VTPTWLSFLLKRLAVPRLSWNHLPGLLFMTEAFLRSDDSRGAVPSDAHPACILLGALLAISGLGYLTNSFHSPRLVASFPYTWSSAWGKHCCFSGSGHPAVVLHHVRKPRRQLNRTQARLAGTYRAQPSTSWWTTSWIIKLCRSKGFTSRSTCWVRHRCGPRQL